MQFSIVSIVAALAAVSSAQYLAPNGTQPRPTGAPSGTGAPVPSATVPFTGGAAIATGAPAMAVLAAGAAALMF